LATEYKIIYTYTGQGNTSANRSLAFNRFVASGDITRKIGQITAIEYEHWHSSQKTMSWGLRGRLVLADGTMFDSDLVYNGISGNVVKYTNTFATLPTPEQFASITDVQTLDTQWKTTAGGYYATLYWRANADNPMRIIVTFIEEPPVVYAPEVKEFSVDRCDESGKADDEGGFASVNLQLGIGDAAGLSNALLRIYYAPNAYPDVDVSSYVDLTARIPEFISGIQNSLDILPGEWNASISWYFAVVFIAGDESAVDTHIMPRAMGSFHVAANHGGACVCCFSNGTEENPMFESYAPGYFYAGIHGVNKYAAGEIDTYGSWFDGEKTYKVFRNIFVFKGVSIPDGTQTIELGEIAGFDEIDTVIEFSGTLRHGSEIYPLPRIWSTSAGTYSIDINAGKIRLRTIDGSGPADIFVQLIYTKKSEEVS
jgi:hypothetical protein